MQEQSVETPVNSMLLAACNRPVGERRVRPHPTQLLKCPRCDSLNTKFCYYNNYNLAQPRHFCKNCRRYWTKGGVLRNVPVGGGCRKNKRSKPRNPDQPRITSAAKSSSNSTTVSSENSTITANIQETSSSSSSYINIPKADRSLSAYRFDSELQQILSMTDPDRVAETLNACTYSSTTTPECSAIPAPRLFNGLASLDYGLLDFQQLPVQPAKREPEIQNSGNLFSNLDAISRPLNSLISRSNFAGVSVSDLQWKLQQQKLASLLEDGLTNNCIEASSTVDPPSVPSGESRSNNNSNNVFPCDWQTNANNEVLFEDLCCWGTDAQLPTSALWARINC